MERGEYPITITSKMYLLIRTEGGIRGNQQSTYDNRGGRGSRQQKGRMGYNFDQQRQGGTHGGTEENKTLVRGRD